MATERNNKNLTINQILSFVIPNLGPVARNGDGGETTDNEQRETKRRDRKHEDSTKFTFAYRPLFYCFVVVSYKQCKYLSGQTKREIPD